MIRASIIVSVRIETTCIFQLETETSGWPPEILWASPSFIEPVQGAATVQLSRVAIANSAAYSNPRSGGINAIGVKEADELIDVWLTGGDDQVVLATRNGKAIRFHEDTVRPMGRVSRGVRGMTLDDDKTFAGFDDRNHPEGRH